MKPHRTPLLANAATGSVHGAAVPSSELRERLSQTRARIARAHAERPPQINLEWDADEPPTRVYQGALRARVVDHAYDASLSALHVEAPADHDQDAWYASLSTQHAEPAPSEPTPRTRAPSNQHAPLPGYAEPAAKPRARAISDEHARLPDHPTNSRTRTTSNEHARPASHANLNARAARIEHAREPSYANLNARAARTEHTRERPHANATRTHAPRSNRTRVRAEQALTARVNVPVATHAPAQPLRAPNMAAAQPRPLPRASFPEPANEHVPSPVERTKLLLTQTASTLRGQLGELHANIDRSDSALRRRVAYCSLALLVAAAVSRMLFAGAGTSERGATETSHGSATQPSAVLQNASVSISSDPPGAQIILDGQPSPQATPAKLSDLATGRHTLSLKLAGYAETKEALNLPADALVSIKLASLSEPRFVPAPPEPRAASRAEQRAQARELARERRAAARAAKVLVRYRARMGLPPDPVAQELVDAYGPTTSAE